MTHPSKEEVEQDTINIKNKLTNIILSWPFVIAILTTLITYSIINELIIWLERVIH